MKTVSVILLTLLVIFIVPCGCASVHIRRITPDNDASADGLRFYRPRPYLFLAKQTPVGGGEFLVSGILDKNNRVVAIDSSHLPPAVADYFAITNASSVAADEKSVEGFKLYTVPFDSVVLPESKDAAKPGDSGKPSDTPSTGSDSKKPTTAPAATTQEAKSPTTRASFESSNEVGQPVVQLNEIFSIVYQPDFDENYVVSVDSGLGSGSADIALKYGWMIEHAKWNVDNTDVGKFLEEQVKTAESVGLSFLNPIAGAASAGTKLDSMATGGQSNQKVTIFELVNPNRTMSVKPKDDVKQSVILRVRYLIVAEPGMYPFLKPRESTRTWWNEHTFHRGWFNKTTATSPVASNPRTTGDDTNSFTMGEMPQNPVLLPVQPYTVVAYNYQRVVQIELVTAK